MNYENTYKIANHTFLIKTKYDYFHLLAKDYLTNENAEYEIEITKQDIDYENEVYIKESKIEQIEYIPTSETLLENTAVYRKVAKYLLNFNIIPYHGSCLVVDNKAYLFIAKSGTGKSTHTRLWREYLKDKVTMLNDDKPLLEINNDLVVAYGNPWNGKHKLGNNIKAPLKAICIINRGQSNSIKEISIQEAYPILIQQSYRDNNNMNTILNLVNILTSKVKLYSLHCNMDIDAAIIAYNTMTKEN